MCPAVPMMTCRILREAGSRVYDVKTALWRKRLGVEPSLPAKRRATGFEDREGHRAPFASIMPDRLRGPTRQRWPIAPLANATIVTLTRRTLLFCTTLRRVSVTKV